MAKKDKDHYVVGFAGEVELIQDTVFSSLKAATDDAIEIVEEDSGKEAVYVFKLVPVARVVQAKARVEQL